ncbi:hypothetical protein [Sorangium cellulosum]|nr:hypothetical protein [Sorangium cellulosum]
MQGESVTTIERREIADALARNVSLDALRQHLEGAAAGEDLLRVVARFVHYASVFGGSQASLAGELSVRQDLFRLPGEPAAVADNGVEVAASIFFGAIDEFGDREMRRTHRALGQAMLKALTRYLGVSYERLDEIVLGHRPTREIVARVLAGYGVNQVKDEAKLFRAFGFHLGTELLADEEFAIFDRFFQTRRPDIVEHLQSTEMDVGGVMYPAYYWVKRHTVADAEHFEAAIDGANRALRHYAGGAARETVKRWLLEGVREIALVELDFLRWVTVET